MKRFQYTVKSLIGLHARPAGLLIQTARAYRSEITIQKRRKNRQPQEPDVRPCAEREPER